MTRRHGLAAVVWAVAAAAAAAQVPAVPPVPGAPPAPAGAAPPAAAPAAPPPKNLFSFFCPTPDQKAACKQKLCGTAAGQMFNSMLMPVGAMTGGMLGPCCPTGPSADALAQPADSPAGAAARIKKDEADAKARAADVRYLGTVDCRYYPEAQAALIAALRADRSECVRIEAARALANGCCCNRKTMAALTIAVNGSDKDGNPAERSECVRALAFLALQRCLGTVVETQTPQPPEPPTPAPPPPAAGGVRMAAYYHAMEADRSPAVVDEARRTVARGLNVSTRTIRKLSGQAALVDVLADTGRPAATAPPPPAADPDDPARRPGTVAEAWQRAAGQ